MVGSLLCLVENKIRLTYGANRSDVQNPLEENVNDVKHLRYSKVFERKYRSRYIDKL